MLKIRLRRMGSRHRPFYRVVVADSRQVPTAAAVEEIGAYHPIETPAVVRVDAARYDYWVGRGAQVSPTVRHLMAQNAPAPVAAPVVPAPIVAGPSEAPAVEAGA